jgi:hypothetical protein
MGIFQQIKGHNSKRKIGRRDRNQSWSAFYGLWNWVQISNDLFTRALNYGMKSKYGTDGHEQNLMRPMPSVSDIKTFPLLLEKHKLL